MRRPNVLGETKPPLPSMLLFDTEDKKDNTDDDSDGNSTGNEDVNGENEQSGGDTDVLENSDQEVTALNLSSKSAKVLILSYSGKKEMDKISRDYLIDVLKELGGKVSLAKSLNFDALSKAVAVKLVNNGFVKLKGKANLSNLARSDIVCKKKKV